MHAWKDQITVTLPLKAIYIPYVIPFKNNEKHIILGIGIRDPIIVLIQKYVEYYHFEIEFLEDISCFSQDQYHHACAIIIDTDSSDTKSLSNLKIPVLSLTSHPKSYTRMIIKPVLPSHIISFLIDVRFEKPCISSRKYETKESDITKTRVLYVEDNKTNILVMSKLLDRIGCIYRVAVNGLEALNILNSEEEFDIIFMDCEMPVMDGLTTTIEIRKSNKRYKGIPIVALTASATEGSEESCKKAGMDAYISKPVRMTHLTNTIKLFNK